VSDLSIDSILKTDDLAEVSVEMPEWGGTVTVRGLGYGEWVDIRDAANRGERQDEKLFSRLLLTHALVSPAVTDDQADALLNKSMSAVNRLADKIMEASNLMGNSLQESEATFQD